MQAWMTRVREWSSRVDLVVLIGVLVLIGGAWGFLAIANRVRVGEAPAIDTRILRAFRNPQNPADPLGPAWVEEAVRDVTGLGSTIVLGLAVVFVLGFLLTCRKFHTFWLVFVASGGGILLSLFLKEHFARPRPAVVPHLMVVSSPSFPSAHAQMAAVIYLTLGAILARLVHSRRQKVYILSVAILLTLLVGISRVYLGVHYPTDVLAGWTTGIMWALLCWLVARGLQKRHMVEDVDVSEESV
jgi:undecaprenyl-diphosphatase